MEDQPEKKSKKMHSNKSEKSDKSRKSSINSTSTNSLEKSNENSHEKSSKQSRDKVESSKKSFKVVIRRLPASKDYDFICLQKDFSNVCQRLSINEEHVCLEHFIQGKLSRKRGPVPGAGFLCLKDEEALKILLSQSPTAVSFTDDDSVQPEIALAPYQKTFKYREKQDKIVGTYETDPEYEAFITRQNNPPQKRLTVEQMIDIKPVENDVDPRNTALLRYLREKIEKGLNSRKNKKLRESSKSKGRDRLSKQKSGGNVLSEKSKKSSKNRGESEKMPRASEKGKSNNESDAKRMKKDSSKKKSSDSATSVSTITSELGKDAVSNNNNSTISNPSQMESTITTDHPNSLNVSNVDKDRRGKKNKNFDKFSSNSSNKSGRSSEKNKEHSEIVENSTVSSNTNNTIESTKELRDMKRIDSSTAASIGGMQRERGDSGSNNKGGGGSGRSHGGGGRRGQNKSLEDASSTPQPPQIIRIMKRPDPVAPPKPST